MNSFDQQRIELIEEHKVTEHFLRQQNEILQEEVDRSGCLVEVQNQRVEELETALHSLNKDLESRKPQPLKVRSSESRSNGSLENGKPKSISILEKGKPKASQNIMVLLTKPKSNGVIDKRTTNGLFEMATPPKPEHEKRTSAKLVPENIRTPSMHAPESRTPSAKPAPESPTPSAKSVPEKQTPNRSGKQSPNIRPRKPWQL